MNTDVSRTDAAAGLLRAGFWRRSLAGLIDMIVVLLPLQAIAAILFALTAGAVQMNSGFYSYCAPTTIPQGLVPPPPHDSNFAQLCRFSLFGVTTGLNVTVGRTTKEGNTTITVSQGYAVDRYGKPINATSLDNLYWLALLLYLVVMVWKTGRPLGARAVKIRVVDAADPGACGAPLHRAIIRYLAMAIGAVPVFALFIYQFAVHGGSADAIFTADFFRWLMLTGAVWCLWALVLTVQIVRKRDPVYDRLAGTAVLRDASGE